MKIIAFDLDNTFLDENKNISERNISALIRAKEQGIEPVPATGRLFIGIPEVLKEVCRYFITVNGARVLDSKTGEIIYEACVSPDLAVEIYNHGDGMDCLYDAYIDGSAYMTQTMHDVLTDYVMDKHYAEQMKQLRIPVPDLKEYILKNNLKVQKMQYFFKDLALRDHELETLPSVYPELKFSYSLGGNIEINSCRAGKGVALEAICAHLGCELKDTVAFGDNTNDSELIEYAGLGYCMINGDANLRKAADAVTEYDCNHNGVAVELERLLNLH